MGIEMCFINFDYDKKNYFSKFNLLYDILYINN